jgi:DNA-binding transcriptional MerR regulator
VNTNDVRFRTAEVAKLADVSLRQLQVWEEKRVAVASRAGRVRLYTVSQALFVIVVAELRRRGLSFQRLRRLSVVLRQMLSDHGIDERRSSLCAFILTDGRQIQFADSPNKTCELVSNFSRPIVCINLADCLDRIDKPGRSRIYSRSTSSATRVSKNQYCIDPRLSRRRQSIRQRFRATVGAA